MRLAFDIETDGLLREVTKIHCIVARDIDTDEEYRWDNGDIKRGLAFLLCADELWGHNIVGYDYQAIREIYPKWVYKGTTYDTLILSRLFFTDLLARGYVQGAAMCKLKEFSPTSRDHIAWAFETFRNWEPKERTASGRAKIDDSVLKEIGTEEALKFSRILELQKHLGQLSEGKNAWLKQERDGRVHHSCILNTNTGRMAHMRPNLAQVPSAPEYRELFYPGKDRVQVGADASGLELRCLGHYLSPFDGGSFARTVVEGDIHTELAQIYGTDRKSGKGVTYCLIYGGGDMKLGLTAGASKRHAAAKGKEIRKRIMEGLDGFAELSAAIQKRSEGDVLRGLDGRPIRLQGKRHASLNYLLQSAGAIICKLWCIRTNELLQEAGIDYWPMAFVHDELQLSVAPSQAKDAEFLITTAMKDVQHQLQFRCQLDSEAQTGGSWADCH
jgi:DNA polymerase-1